MRIPSAIESLAGAEPQKIGTIRGCSPVAGGDISSAFKLETTRGSFFAKTHNSPPKAMYETEYNSLVLMAKFGLPVPKVIAYSEGALILEYLPPQSSDMIAMGKALAGFHRKSAEAGKDFGLEFDNYIGSSPQFNNPAMSWPVFFAEMRIQKQAAMIKDKFGTLAARAETTINAFAGYLKDNLPATEAALVHGDLWGGNLYGNYFIDPAIYYGHREVDIAMTRMFGGFTHDFYTGYESVWPLDAGWQERIAIYNTYHQLNHYLLFGSGHYLSSALATMNRAVSN